MCNASDNLESVWERMINEQGCLISSANVNFSKEGSIFKNKEWQELLKNAQTEKAVFDFLLSKFPSLKITKIHICNFENAQEGSLALFTVQQILLTNWNEYNGENETIRNQIKSNDLWHISIKKILNNSKSCKEIRDFFALKYRELGYPDAKMEMVYSRQLVAN